MTRSLSKILLMTLMWHAAAVVISVFVVKHLSTLQLVHHESTHYKEFQRRFRWRVDHDVTTVQFIEHFIADDMLPWIETETRWDGSREWFSFDATIYPKSFWSRASLCMHSKRLSWTIIVVWWKWIKNDVQDFKNLFWKFGTEIDRIQRLLETDVGCFRNKRIMHCC